MKNRMPENGPKGQESMVNQKSKKTMKKNKMRMGGEGLSLEAFANAKAKSDHYNHALIKKQREFYKNAKYVNKYKKLQKHESHQIGPSSAISPPKDGDESGRSANNVNRRRKKNKKESAQSLKEIYEKKREEQEKARIEREAIIQAKREKIEKAESRRKTLKGKMLKRTRSGQPVMKYRIEHILETLQGASKS